MPYYPSNDGSKAFFSNLTSDNKLVADYANISIPETYNLDVFTFWGLLHDSVVYICNKTKEGKEYLENAYVYSQKKADRGALRRLFGGGNNGK